MPFHKGYVGHNIHAITANPDDGSYADIAARDADTAWQVVVNINKVVRVESPLSFYILASVGPAVWREITSTVINNWVELLDTPTSVSPGLVVQGNAGGTALEFGQNLNMTSNPTFASLILTDDLTVQGAITFLDTETLLVEDKNIELGKVAVPTDITADGGGFTLKGTTDKTWLYNRATESWDSNLPIRTGNLELNDNTLSSTDVNGDIVLSPNGTGDVSISSNTIIGSTSVNPDGALHVHVGSSGAVTASGVANALVVEDSTNNGISILTPAANSGRIIFGSPADPFGAFIAWSDSVNDFAIGSSKIGANFRLTSDQETTNLTLSGGAGSELATFAKDVNVSGTLTADQVDANNLRLQLNTLTNTDGVGGINIITGQSLLILADGVAMQGTSPAATGTGSQYIRFRDDRTTVTSAPNYVLAISRQNSALISLWLGNDGNGDAILVTGDNDLRIGNDVTGTFTENVRFTSDGTAGFGTQSPDASAILDLTSTTKGFLPPRMTTTQIDAIASPATGLESYDTTINKKKVFTGAEFKTLLTEDIGQVLVQETFASSNVRFFGELALPAAQGWTDTATGIATIDLVTQTVFGEVKQVVRHNDDTTGGATTSVIVLTAQKWLDINAFGASYGGVERLDTVNGGSGFFSGLQANAAENPLATGNRRYGVLFDNSGGNLRLREADNTGNVVIMDGTGGNPLVTFDEWFRWECVVPAGLGAAQVYINGILTTFVPTFFTNTGGLGTQIQVGSGSTGGANRIVYHDNFGVTIYEEAVTKTLSAATMAGDVAQINIPEGKRDYVIILPDGNPRPIGSVLRLVANNLGGSVSLQNENSTVPEILYNGLRTLVINVAVKETIEAVNTVSSGNVYLGFEITTLHVGGKFIDTTDQAIVTANTPQVITFNINKILDGVSHTIGSSVFTINTSGKHELEVAPQVFQGSGAAKVEFWLRRNGTDIVNSGVQFDIGANSQALPILIWKEDFAATDTFECVWASNSANTKLDNLTSLFGGPNIPSIMFRMTLVAI